MRRLLPLTLIVVFCSSLVLAEEYKAKIKDVDVGKGTVSFTVGDKVITLPVKDDAKILQAAAKGKTETPLVGGLAGVAPGRDAAISTTKIDGKETVTTLRVEPLAKTKLK